MSDSSIEKSFLYAVLISFLVHTAAFFLVVALPTPKIVNTDKPIMVELADSIPSPQQQPLPMSQEVRRQAEKRQRVIRETAPKGTMPMERVAPQPERSARQMAATQGRRSEAPQKQAGDGKARQELQTKAQPAESAAGESVLRPPSGKSAESAQLFPSARRMAMLEESYRKKFGPEVEEGDTRFLNSDDILFGSFLRRFESAIYAIWRYPAEASRLGIEGVTPVKITFNRSGEIERVEVLESSGSRVLDEEVLRTLRHVGPVGSLPKNYQKDHFNLIAFFQYGIFKGGSRTLH